jgi:DNA invertase Pin-like site-specific DNA recombinase
MEKRPGLAAVVGRLHAGEADALAVAKLDRLTRSVRDLADLAELGRPRGRRPGWGLILLDVDVDSSTPSGEFLMNVMGSAAQWERRLISQRTREALAVKRAQGVRLGRPSKLDPKVVAKIVRWHDEGVSFSGIARLLTFERIPTAHRGSKWWPATVRKVLQGQEASRQALSASRGARTAASALADRSTAR